MSLDEDGYWLSEQVFSAAECLSLAERLTNLNRDSAGTRTLLAFDWCRSLALALREQLSDPLGNLIPVQCTYFQKSPKANWHVAWHQDRSIPVAANFASARWSRWTRKENLWFVEPPREVLESLVAARVHLDDSHGDNGPLRVVAGSHQAGVLAPKAIAHRIEQQRETICVANTGSVLLMHPLLLHASGKSVAESNRRVLHVLFGPAELPDGAKWPAWPADLLTAT